MCMSAPGRKNSVDIVIPLGRSIVAAAWQIQQSLPQDKNLADNLNGKPLIVYFLHIVIIFLSDACFNLRCNNR